MDLDNSLSWTSVHENDHMKSKKLMLSMSTGWCWMATILCFIFNADIRNKIIPGVTHWQSPEYFAYYPSNSSIAGFLGEMLSAGVNVVGFSWITSPAATELETIVMDWLGKALKLPDAFLSTGIDITCSCFKDIFECDSLEKLF